MSILLRRLIAAQYIILFLVLPNLALAGPETEHAPAPQVHEEMWAIPSSPVPMLAYLIRPVGGGPFPLVVMNHGVSLDTTGRSYFPAIEFRDAALWFARQGYVVVAPVRPGYGRQIAGSFAQYEKARLVHKLAAARARKKALTGRCGGRKPLAELRPEVVTLAREMHRQRMSLRKISAALAEQGHVTGGGRPYTANAVQTMLRRK